MIQFIFFLLVLFAISCVFYGIAAGVQGIHRGWNHLLQNCNTTTKDKANKKQRTSTQADYSYSSTPIFHELKVLFGLYQTDALTQAEYEQSKKHLLSTISNS